MKKILILALCLFFFWNSNVHAAQLNKIAAVVNGQVITMFDLQKNAIPDLARARVNPDDPKHSEMVGKIFRSVLDNMIMDILIAQEAKRLKISVSSGEIDNEIESIMKDRRMTKAQFESQLAQQKISLTEFRKNIEMSFLRKKVMNMEVRRRIVVTPEEVKAYYEKNRDKFFDLTGLHMGVLVYPPNVNAKSIAEQIKSKKISFREACAKYSIAPNKDKSGDMGEVEWDRLNQEWSERLNNMKPGEVTELFDLQGRKAQVHLFYPDGRNAQPLTYEQAKPRIESILSQPKAKNRFDDYTRQLRDKAVIDIRL